MKQWSSVESSRAEHGTYPLTLDQERDAMLQAQRQARQERIMQVRAQEMHLAAKSAGQFRQRRKNDSLKLLQVLREAWEEEQAKRRAALEADYLNRYQGIGQSYAAAHLLASGALADQKEKEAEEDQLWKKLRFQRAVQEEKARKREVLQERLLAESRRKVLNEASRMERLRTRNLASQERPTVTSVQKIAVPDKEGPERYLKIDISTNVTSNIIHSRLPADPSAYKDTYFHSSFSGPKVSASRRTVASSEDDRKTQSDAWEAAESQRKTMENEKELKKQMEGNWQRRKAERGQAAAAKLQKIALLEKELALESEEEQVMKRQLQMIEDLTKAVQSPEQKSDKHEHLQAAQSQAELGATFEQNTEENDAKIPDVKDPECITEPAVQSISKKESEGVPFTSQPPPVVDDEHPVREFSPSTELNEKLDEARCQSAKLEGAESKYIKPAYAEDLSQPQFAEPCISGPTSKDADKNEVGGGPAADSAKPLSRRPLTQSGTGATKAVKDSRLRSKLPSASTFNRKDGVRKGNKSPEKFEGERKAPASREEKDAGRYIRELQARSVEIAKDQASPSACETVEAGDGQEPSPAKERRAESCKRECKEASPRKESNSWLCNILDKLPWWKCDTSGTAGSLQTPRAKLQKKECPQEVPAARKNVAFRMETLGSLNTLRDVDWYCDEDLPLSSRAQTKVVFTQEELEALKLELYGTLTGETVTSEQKKKVILGKEKVKQGHRLDLKQQQPPPSPHIVTHGAEEPFPKTTSLVGEVHHVTGYHAAERNLECPKSNAQKLSVVNGDVFGYQVLKGDQEGPRAKQEKARVVARHENKVDKEGDSLRDEQNAKATRPVFASSEVPQQGPADSRGNDHQKRRSTKDNGTQCVLDEQELLSTQTVNLWESTDKAKDVQTCIHLPKTGPLQDKGKKPAAFIGPSVNPNSGKNSCLNFSKVAEISKSSAEDPSAHEVADELIKAWRAGQIGGDIHAAFHRARQVSRKRRAAADIEPKGPISLNCSKASQKLGQLREKMNKSQEKSTSKLRKWDVLTPHREETLDNTSLSASKSQDLTKCDEPTLNRVHSSPRASNPAAEENFQAPGKKLSELSDALERKVEDVVPEARSLDFILGSLSAQVRELDERLQNVTACSMGTPAFPCTGSRHEEGSSISDLPTLTENTSCREKVSRLPTICSVSSLSLTGGNTEIVKGDESNILSLKAEPVFRAGAEVLAPTDGPFVSTEAGNLPLSPKDEEKLTGSKSEAFRNQPCGSSPSPIPQVQSPGSSMGICLEDMAELMQEMGGSPACQRMRAQLLQDSVFESLLRRRESGAGAGAANVEKEDIVRAESVDRFRKRNTDSAGGIHSDQEERDTAEDFSVNMYSDFCSKRVDGPSAPDDEKQMPDGRKTLPAGTVSEQFPLQPGRVSLSSLDLIEAMKLDETEEHLLLSSSVDFSPWKTDIIPDVFSFSKGFSYVASTRTSRDDGVKVDQCHLKDTSKYQLSTNEFKKKCKAFERKRLGRKHKKTPKKPFNPLALPPKRASTPRSSTCSLQPGALKHSKGETKITMDSRPRSKLTSRSLPDDFHSTVAAEEVQKWLGRDLLSCTLVAPDDARTGRKSSVVKYPSNRRPVTAQERLSQQKGSLLPPLAKTNQGVPKRQPEDSKCSMKQASIPRSRPSSVGVV
ncbi:hypothetical protein R1sor_015889 [Riccia sorocarpa]|uniref:Uncharacterized protein n=1 Tax=Riccia sorocarpa TaxID=122646 RepID=A0ABD3HDH4_9MARC